MHSKRCAKTKDILYKHAQKRALQRYGLELTWQMFERYNQRLCREIKDAGVLFLAKESERVTHYLLDDVYIVTYDKQRKAISSFLPADAINNYLTGSTYIQERKAWKR